MLVRVFGSTTPAVSVVVAAFMGGLALGSHWGARRSRLGARLKDYASLELLAAISGVLATALMIFLPELYAHIAGHAAGPAQRVAVRLTLAALVLLPPTTVMGATLPILTRFVSEREKKIGLGLAVLYGFNTLGAVVGTLFSGFIALALFGERSTVGMAVATNLACALVAIRLAGKETKVLTLKEDAAAKREDGYFLALFALSGFCALALEVLWSRLMILLVGSSVYAFSALLAVDLFGVGLGSLVCAALLRRGVPRSSAPLLFGLLQAGIGAAVMLGLAGYRVSGLSAVSLNYLYSPLNRPADVLSFFRDCIIVVFPPTFLMGLSFPLAGLLLSTNDHDEGVAAGRAFAANTMGGVLGSLAAGFLLVPALGTAHSCALLAAISMLIGVAALRRAPQRRSMAWKALATLGAVTLVAGWMSGDPARDILTHRLASIGGELVFHREQTAATVSGVSIPRLPQTLLLNGIAVSGTGGPGKAMAYVPLLLRPHAKRVLVICFGAGNAFRAAMREGLQVDAVDLVPGVFEAFPWFFPDDAALLTAPNARTFVDDGRHFLLTSPGGYDVIVVDGSPPIYAAATVNLYTREFMALARSRLGPGGVLALWAPLPCRLDDFGALSRNFADAFAHVAAWRHPGFAGVLLMGSESPLTPDARRIASDFKRLGSTAELPGMNPGLVAEGTPFDEAALRRISALFAPLTDDEPRTEYPLFPMLSGDRFFMRNEPLLGAFLSLDPGLAAARR